MKAASKAAVLGILTLGVAAVAVVRGGERSPPPDPQAGPGRSSRAHAIPRLVDVGAGKCIPCKAMAPILENLKAEYAGQFEVQFVDVWQDPDAARPYRIKMIPTQIFYGADGRELARHEGFMSKDEILAQWRAVGVSH